MEQSVSRVEYTKSRPARGGNGFLYGDRESERLHSLFLDTGFLTGELAQVVQLGAAYLTDFVDRDALDERRLDREDSLYTDVVGHLANRETLLVTMTGDADHYAAIHLDTLLVTLLDTVSDRNRVATLERRMFFFRGECLFCNLN